ncbi:amidohydrolase family protein [Yinghuangia seranimata]|uniref:amidohydrolase family protein n=1 Tax=Yinghuangia seranimata TaxID=408067 RepID=UPI00248CFA81|nr:amidohydrolase family protein [Yinghuangia seranimata]MDI2132402.1 amidohydrolase family protein [Yinghuangia seranimata]
MAVIDVDAHFEPARDWLDQFPKLRDRLPAWLPDDDPEFAPNTPEHFAYAAFPLRQAAARDGRVPMSDMTTPFMRAIFPEERPADFNLGGHSQWQEVDTAARIRLLDQQGIALQNIMSGLGMVYMSLIRDTELGKLAVGSLNTHMAEATAGHRDRLLPVTLLRYDDLDWSIQELTRMRALGSRAFHVTTEAVGGVPLFHRDFDRFWSTAENLGMIAILHVGLANAAFDPGYANTPDPSVLTHIATAQTHQMGEVFLNAMVFGGVFERHPKLTALIAELGVGWVPYTVANMDGRATPESAVFLHEYKLPLKPSEYVQRNVRITPLPNAGQLPFDLFEQLPGVAVFSSDIPHFEGNLTPVEFYEKELAETAADVRDGFLSGNIAESYARMGDPLALPS